MFNTKDNPKTFEEAMASRDSSLWKEVVNDGIDSILSNNFWVAMDVPTGFKPIGCKWAFRKKYNTNETVQNFKVKLVVKGFKQRNE